MTHKEKCSALKQVRKTIADKLGIDLHQTECTYEGECSGTCPKCAHEEKILNKAILGSTIVASSIALCACDMTSVPKVERTDREEFCSTKGNNKGDNKGNKSGEMDPDIELAGEEVAPIDYDGGLGTMDPAIDDELAGDVAIAAYSYDVLCQAAAEFTGAPICEVESENDDGTITIHCYEVVDNGDGDVHTATVNRLYIYVYGGYGEDMNGEEVDLNPYIQ